ncbi:class A beta-lactamase [soil metagenome]
MKVLSILFVAFCFVFTISCGEPSVPKSNSITTVANANSAAPSPIPTPNEILTAELRKIADEAQGKVGVHAVLLETGETVSLNADERFAMQSVVKVPISMAVIQKAVAGELDLDEKIKVGTDELVTTRMHSPFRDKNPNGGETTIRELIELAVSVSDGTAADVLQRVAGGAEGVQSYIDSLGIDAMKVRYTHKEFSNNNERQYENWATPKAAVQLLHSLWKQKGTAEPGDEAREKELLLLSFMYDTPTGPNRLKGLLPKGTLVAHKTGSSGTVDGVTTATNDVGIVIMPDGRQFIIAVFVGDSRADEKTREAVIAKSAKAVWDAWLN